MDISKFVKPAGEAAKVFTSVLGGVSAAYLIDDIVKTALPAPAKPVYKVLTLVGTSMLSGALADIAVDRWCDDIDYVVGAICKDKPIALDTAKLQTELESVIAKHVPEAFDVEFAVKKKEEENAGNLRPEDVEGGTDEEA